MVDPDDVAHWRRLRQLNDLAASAEMLSDPAAGYGRWLDVVAAVLAAKPHDGEDLVDVLAGCAQWVSVEIRHAL